MAEQGFKLISAELKGKNVFYSTTCRLIYLLNWPPGGLRPFFLKNKYLPHRKNNNKSLLISTQMSLYISKTVNLYEFDKYCKLTKVIHSALV